MGNESPHTSINVSSLLKQLSQTYQERQQLCLEINTFDHAQRLHYISNNDETWKIFDRVMNNTFKILDGDDTSFDAYEFITYENLKTKLERQTSDWLDKN